MSQYVCVLIMLELCSIVIFYAIMFSLYFLFFIFIVKHTYVIYRQAFALLLDCLLISRNLYSLYNISIEYHFYVVSFAVHYE